MLFDGPADLPTATLRPRASEARHRVIVGQLHRWLAPRWAWLRPRTVPLIAAFVGMLAILGATKYLSAYARGDLMKTTKTTNTAIGAASPVEITLDQPAARR